FQAEDGIRDRNVTGVQTCALPISSGRSPDRRPRSMTSPWSSADSYAWNTTKGPWTYAPGKLLWRAGVSGFATALLKPKARSTSRSEERRVGKEGRRRGRED